MCRATPTRSRFRNPRPVRQTVLHISFDPKGNVAAINHTGRELVMNVDPGVHRSRAPTLGRKKSFFDELFGNIGQVGSGGLGAPTNQQYLRGFLAALNSLKPGS